jgi:hypothetical protein
MAAALVVFAIAFDTYVIKSDNALAKLNFKNAVSDITDGNVLDTIMVQFRRLV